jgi:ABC-type transport system substrate-binding protein
VIRFAAPLLAFLVAAAVPVPAAAADPAKVLRIAFPDVTLLDPQQLTDLYSARVVGAVFEGLYEYEYLSDPARIVPNTAEALPEITEGGRVWTIRIKRGIRFADHPAFKGRPRELVASDYVYSLKRWLDPTLKAGGEARLTDLIVGARAVVDAARSGGRFDYDAPIAGLRALDSHTLRFELAEVDYTLLEVLARVQAYAVAREVIEASGGDPSAHAVGTGPYRVAEWKRGSRLVLVASPGYRDVAFPAVRDPALQPLAAAMAGAKLPAVGRIELDIIEEEVPEILAFERGDLDFALLTGRGAQRLLPGGKLRGDLAKRGVRHVRYTVPALIYTYFNMDDAVVGGSAQDRIALRRAIGMGFNVPEMIRVLYGGDAIPASQFMPPGVESHDPAIPPKSTFDPAAARALLDRFGYRDRNGDGYRERPDGSPLVLSRASTTDSFARESDLLWLSSMKAIGLRMEVQSAPFAELLKRSLAGQLQMFNLGYRADSASGYSSMTTLWGKAPPDTNRARFRNADYDAAYEAFLRTPPGPQRLALARRMSEIVQAHAPIVFHVYPQGHAFVHPWLKGYRPSAFGTFWKYVDIDVAAKAAARTAR